MKAPDLGYVERFDDRPMDGYKDGESRMRGIEDAARRAADSFLRAAAMLEEARRLGVDPTALAGLGETMVTAEELLIHLNGTANDIMRELYEQGVRFDQEQGEEAARQLAWQRGAKPGPAPLKYY